MKSLLALLLAVSVGLFGCSGGGSGSGSSATGSLELSATDAPFAHHLVTDAHISVTKITIHSSSGANSGFRTLYDGPAIDLDLLSLQNGVTQSLVQAQLPVGDYRQIRLLVSAATLTLVNGNVYSTAAGTLDLTSQDTSGFKVLIEPPVHVSSAVAQSLLLDFDLSKTFKPIPANDPLTATSYKLHPVIHVANLSTTGEFRGLVTKDGGGGQQIPAAAATVYVLPPGELDPNNSIASTGTLLDGHYAVLGLDPGTYDILAVRDLLQARVNGQTIAAGNATTVDLSVQ